MNFATDEEKLSDEMLVELLDELGQDSMINEAIAYRNLLAVRHEREQWKERFIWLFMSMTGYHCDGWYPGSDGKPPTPEEIARIDARMEAEARATNEFQAGTE